MKLEVLRPLFMRPGHGQEHLPHKAQVVPGIPVLFQWVAIAISWLLCVCECVCVCMCVCVCVYLHTRMCVNHDDTIWYF